MKRNPKKSIASTPIPQPPRKNSLNNALDQIDVSTISHIHFRESTGKTYKITLNSIKQIALYISQKSGKTVFAPNELAEERDILIKYYKSSLPEKEYKTLIEYLSRWVEVGGSIEITRR